MSPATDLEISVHEPLVSEELRKIDAYWRASNYLAVGMIYLRENPLLKQPLKVEHIKERLLGHWGSVPGQTTVPTPWPAQGIWLIFSRQGSSVPQSQYYPLTMSSLPALQASLADKLKDLRLAENQLSEMLKKLAKSAAVNAGALAALGPAPVTRKPRK